MPGFTFLNAQLLGKEDGVHGDDLELGLQEPPHAGVRPLGGLQEAKGHALPVPVVVDTHEVVMDALPVLTGGQVDVGFVLTLKDRAILQGEIPVVGELAADGDEAEGAGWHPNLDLNVGGGFELLGLGAGEGAGAGDAVVEGDIGDDARGGRGEVEAQELGVVILDGGGEFGRLGGGGGGQANHKPHEEGEHGEQDGSPHASSPMRPRR